MTQRSLALALMVVAIAVAGCGRIHVPAFLGGQPSQASGTRVQGTVQTFDGSTVTLQDGTSYKTDNTTRVTRSAPAALTDLTKGDVVAVTAVKQADNSLLASIVNVFPASQQITLGQRPLTGGNLMTNATIDSIDPTGFSVTFPNGTAVVKLAPDAKISKSIEGTLADVKVGTTVALFITDGVAKGIQIR